MEGYNTPPVRIYRETISRIQRTSQSGCALLMAELATGRLL
jgi:hypothetical protein